MNIYKEYKATKHPEDDFLRWLLIRKFNIKQQLLFIIILWFLWALAWPNLRFWVFFFEGVLAYCILSVFVGFVFKIVTLREID